jgi:2,5-diketo-D-gluconate reductase A
MQTVSLTTRDGIAIPQLGLGTWQTPDEVAAHAVSAALKTGYRLIDTAAIYANERGVGEGIARGLAENGLRREEIFVTTKLWNSDQGFDEALRALDASLARLCLAYVDLYLIHWPAPRQDRYVASWKALIRLQQEGRARAIGVSNFEPPHLQRLIDETHTAPAVNQIELHPDFPQQALRDFHARHGILTQSWSPLGQGHLIAQQTIVKIAKKHCRTPAQILVRWHLEEGLLVIPKSTRPERIAENFAVFDFALDQEDRAEIARLGSASRRIGPHPDTADF